MRRRHRTVSLRHVLGDTIVALASARGASERAVLRLSGPAAPAAAALLFAPALPPGRAVQSGVVRVRGREVPALALGFAAPASFTGEAVVELHVPGSPLLVQCLLDTLLEQGARLGVRQALPGEFTARAYRHGKLDALAVEGLLGLLHAQDARAAAAAVPWLQGGLAATVAALRSDLQDLLAHLEAGLDFTDDETGGGVSEAAVAVLAAAEQRVAALLEALPRAATGGAVLLFGCSNIGKSALGNALAGRAVALVADQPGTTRDLVAVPVGPGVLLWDGPGDLDAQDEIEAAALALRDRLAGGAAALLLVLDAAAPRVPPWQHLGLPVLAVVWSRLDRVAAVPALPAALREQLPGDTPVLATSALDGRGVAELRALLGQSAATGGVQAGTPLRRAFAAVGEQLAHARGSLAAAPELAAAAVLAALQSLAEADGDPHSAEPVLERIYARFCLGK